MASVLAPARLTADTLGVIAWIEQDAARLHVPISVSERQPALAEHKSIVAILRSSIDLDDLRWRSSAEGNSANLTEWRRASSGGPVLRAGQPIRLEFERSKGGAVVEVSAKAINSDRWLPLRLRIFEP